MMLRKFIVGFLLGLSLLSLSAVSVPLSQAETTVDDASPTGQVTQPTIPVPDFLPAPDVGERGYDTQNYILNETIPRAINIVIGILGIATFLGILFSSVQMLTAYGNEDKVKRAKTNLYYGIFGFVIVILAYGIVSVVVSVALPNEQDSNPNTSFFSIPSAYAVDVEEDVDILFPSQRETIEDQDEDNRVSLPGGNFLGEIVPAVITNVMYATAFLVFVAFMYGGVLLVIGRGNEESVTKAKSILIYSALALALISLGYAIVYGLANLNLNKNDNSTTDEIFVNTEERND
ncbi:MAG: pilin [Candidatus Gracilibacteria bacterium]